MKLRNYVVLMAIGIVAVMFTPVVPCGAAWEYIASDVSTGPNSGSDYDSGVDFQWEWSFSITGISNSADSGGASASATCDADAWAEVNPTGASVSKDPSTYCTCYGRSIYSQPSGNDILYYDWDIDGSGTVDVYGFADGTYLGAGDSADADSTAYGDVDCSDEYGGGYATGSVSETGNGSASTYLSGVATEDSSSTTETSGYYEASLSFSVEASETDQEEDGSSFEASASVNASASASASVSASAGKTGTAEAGATGSCSASASVSVSY